MAFVRFRTRQVVAHGEKLQLVFATFPLGLRGFMEPNVYLKTESGG